MTPVKIRLSDSISLSAIQTDKFKTAILSISLTLPLTRENAIGNTVLASVMKRGTEKYESMAELNRALDELYDATVYFKSSRCGRNCVFRMSAEMLDDTYVIEDIDILDGVLEIMAQILLHPKKENGAFPLETLTKEKKQITDAIRAEMNNPRAYASDRCSELMSRRDPELATLEDMLCDVAEMDAEKLYKHYKKLLSESALSVYYVGNEAPARVGEAITKHFSSFAGKAQPTVPIKPEEFFDSIEKTEQMAVSQGKLAMGFRIGTCMGDEDFFAASMFNEILGGSPASKLFMNVRERMSLCYYCGSRYNEYLGNITVSAGINVSDRERTYSAILEQIEEIKKGNISESELIAAKKTMAHALRQIYDYPSDLISFHANKAIFGIETTPEYFAERYAAVTLDEIVAVASKIKLDSVFFLEGTLDGDGEEDNDE